MRQDLTEIPTGREDKREPRMKAKMTFRLMQGRNVP
jgi:hypothetical protein